MLCTGADRPALCVYDLERRADQENLSFEERSDLRSRLSYPIMVAFEKCLENEYPKVLPFVDILASSGLSTKGVLDKCSIAHTGFIDPVSPG